MSCIQFYRENPGQQIVNLGGFPLTLPGGGATLGSLSNHDADSNKNPTNLHIWQWKTVFLHALHVHFSSFDSLKTF